MCLWLDVDVGCPMKQWIGSVGYDTVYIGTDVY